MIAACLKWVDRRPEVDPITGVVHDDHRFAEARELVDQDWQRARQRAQMKHSDDRLASDGPGCAKRFKSHITSKHNRGGYSGVQIAGNRLARELRP
jgi:hypothetical protein